MPEEFHQIAEQFPDPFRLLVRESETSTNDALLKLGNEGAADGLTLLALEQTQGRGRRGSTWFSQTGDTLAFSILVNGHGLGQARNISAVTIRKLQDELVQLMDQEAVAELVE